MATPARPSGQPLVAARGRLDGLASKIVSVHEMLDSLPDGMVKEVGCDSLPEGFELDDDPLRIDVDAVQAFISSESYWGQGRTRESVEQTIRGSTRVVGLYHHDRQIGFARCVCDGVTVGYLADVYVLAEFRSRGLGLALVREAIEGQGSGEVRWLLHTRDAQGLYEKLGFGPDKAPYPLMERPAPKPA